MSDPFKPASLPNDPPLKPFENRSGFISSSDPVLTQAEKDAAKAAEEVRLKAIADAKTAEEQKAQALKDAELQAKKTAEDNAARAKVLHEEDLLRQKEAKEQTARIDVKLKERRAVKEKRAAEALEEAAIVLKEYGGAEANIPVNNGYWGLMNEYRGLVSELR